LFSQKQVFAPGFGDIGETRSSRRSGMNMVIDKRVPDLMA
jgi:hypothetical protein